jgi:pimeloyl-ACP methyl ester carboxylesterase/DNA-binding CsgD family transcriptional regulator
MTSDQVIRYADVDGTSVAWSAVGDGPPLVVCGWWNSHLELNWEDTRFRDYIGRLAQHRTVIRYDRPGSGASSRSVRPPTSLEEEYAVLRAVVDAVGVDGFALFAGSSGCPVAVRFTARHPERVEALVLYGGYARGADIAPPDARETLLSIVARHWGLGSRVLADLFLPDATTAERDLFTEFQRRSSSPELAAASLRATYSFDVAAEAADVAVPTLVLHRRDDRAIPFALGRDLADRVPGAEFVGLDGSNHLPWRGDRVALANEIIRFLGGKVEEVEAVAPVLGELSTRELEVLRLVAEGCTDADIAAQLVVSPHTVHRHIANIRTKLGVSSRAAAAAWAAARNIL